MIIHYIKNNTETFLMKAFNHFLKFPDAGDRIGRIGGVTSVRHVIVFGIISPIITVFF